MHEQVERGGEIALSSSCALLLLVVCMCGDPFFSRSLRVRVGDESHTHDLGALTHISDVHNRLITHAEGRPAAIAPIRFGAIVTMRVRR